MTELQVCMEFKPGTYMWKEKKNSPLARSRLRGGGDCFFEKLDFFVCTLLKCGLFWRIGTLLRALCEIVDFFVQPLHRWSRGSRSMFPENLKKKNV